MPFQPGKPRLSIAAASALAAAGLVLTVASCGGHLTPLGPDPAATLPPPRHLGSPIVLQAMLVQPPSPAGGCSAGYAVVSGPGLNSGCFRKTGTPVTITSAAVTPYQPRNPPGAPAPQPGTSGLMITLPAADAAALKAVTTTAYDARGVLNISVAGKTWMNPLQAAPFAGRQLPIMLPSQNLALQLQRILIPPG